MNTVFISVVSVVSIPLFNMSPVGRSSVIFVLSFISFSNSIIKSKFTWYDISCIPICFNNVPSIFIASFSLYVIVPRFFTIIEKSIIPPWFDICSFSPFVYVSCAPIYSIFSLILYCSWYSYNFSPCDGLYISILPFVSFGFICILFIVIFRIIATFLYYFN